MKIKMPVDHYSEHYNIRCWKPYIEDLWLFAVNKNKTPDIRLSGALYKPKQVTSSLVGTEEHCRHSG